MNRTRCVCETCMPLAASKSKSSKISKSLILTLHQPQGHVISVKCKQHSDKLTVIVWLLYHHPNFIYCYFCVGGTELWTDRQTNRTSITRCPLVDHLGWRHKMNVKFAVWNSLHWIQLCFVTCSFGFQQSCPLKDLATYRPAVVHCNVK